MAEKRKGTLMEFDLLRFWCIEGSIVASNELRCSIYIMPQKSKEFSTVAAPAIASEPQTIPTTQVVALQLALRETDPSGLFAGHHLPRPARKRISAGNIRDSFAHPVLKALMMDPVEELRRVDVDRPDAFVGKVPLYFRSTMTGRNPGLTLAAAAACRHEWVTTTCALPQI